MATELLTLRRDLHEWRRRRYPEETRLDSYQWLDAFWPRVTAAVLALESAQENLYAEEMQDFLRPTSCLYSLAWDRLHEAQRRMEEIAEELDG